MSLDVPYAGLLIEVLRCGGTKYMRCQQSDLIYLHLAKCDHMCEYWRPDYDQPLSFEIKLTPRGKEFAKDLTFVYNL